jgi:hypothetical protein
MIYSSSEQFNHTLKENQFLAEASDCRIWTAMMLANSHFIWSEYLLVVCVLVSLRFAIIDTHLLQQSCLLPIYVHVLWCLLYFFFSLAFFRAGLAQW